MEKVRNNLIVDPSLFRSRSSIFNVTCETKEIFKKSLDDFIACTECTTYSRSNFPITWERMSRGYRIVDYQIHKTEEVLEILKKYYFCKNETCPMILTHMNSDTIHAYQKFILQLAGDDNSFLAIEEGFDDLVGLAMTNTHFLIDDDDNFEAEEKVEESHSKSSNRPLDAVQFDKSLLHKANVYECYKVDRFFCIHVVCVKPKLWSRGIGTALVQACLTKAQKLKFPVCVGLFAAGPGQTIAERLGFEILAQMEWINVKHFKNSNELSEMEKSYVSCMGRRLIDLSLDRGWNESQLSSELLAPSLPSNPPSVADISKKKSARSSKVKKESLTH